jgi:hypothetical protein
MGLLTELQSGNPEILEEKYSGRQLVPWRTRGIATAIPSNNKPKLAKGGMQTPKGVSDPNAFMLRLMMTRKPDDTLHTQYKPDFRRSTLDFSRSPNDPEPRRYHDFVYEEGTQKVNFEYDFKRKPVNPRMGWVRLADGSEYEHLAFDTVPWDTIVATVQKLWPDFEPSRLLHTAEIIALHTHRVARRGLSH